MFSATGSCLCLLRYVNYRDVFCVAVIYFAVVRLVTEIYSLLEMIGKAQNSTNWNRNQAGRM